MTTNINFNSDWLTEFVKQLFRFFRQLTKPTRLTIVVLLILMAFWFLAIYFIGRPYYNGNPFLVLLLLSFVASVGWLVANIILFSLGIATLAPAFEEMGYDTSEPTKDEEIIVYGGLNSIVYLTVILAISAFNHLTFSTFVLLCCGYPVFALVLLGIAFVLLHRK